MIALSILSAVLAGAVLAVLIAGAAWALYVGLGARAAAEALGDDHARAEALLASAPAQAAVVRGDGRIDVRDA